MLEELYNIYRSYKTFFYTTLSCVWLCKFLI